MKSTLERVSKEDCKLEMTPMIDVTFLLLIFFMCTLKFKTLEGKLAAYLPKDVGVNTMQAEPIPKVEIQLRVVTAGTKYDPRGSRFGEWSGKPGTRYSNGDDRVIQYSIGPRKTNSLAEVQDRLKALHREDEKRPATIDARPGTIYADVVKVLDAALDAGFTEVTFVGSYE